MANRRLHPAVTQTLIVGLNVFARAAAKAFDSVLKDVGTGLGAAEGRVKTVRRNLRRKVKESTKAAGWEDQWQAPRGSTCSDEEE